MAHQQVDNPNFASQPAQWSTTDRRRSRGILSAVTSAFASATQTAAHEFERICESVGLRSRDHETLSNQTENEWPHKIQTNVKPLSPGPIYGRVIPDQGRRRWFRDLDEPIKDVPLNDHHRPIKRTRLENEPAKKPRPAKRIPPQILVREPSPMTTLMAEGVFTEDERMAKLERDVLSIRAKMAGLASSPTSPKRPLTVRFSPVASSMFDTNITGSPATPTSSTPSVSSVKASSPITSSPTSLAKALSPTTSSPPTMTKISSPTTSPPPSLTKLSSSATSSPPSAPETSSASSSSSSSSSSPEDLHHPKLVRAAYRQHHRTQSIPNDSYKEKMKDVIAQIPNVSLRRVDTLRGPDGVERPNPFWNEIYKQR